MQVPADTQPHNEPTVLFEDACVLVLNKPSGLVVHSDGRTQERTLADWLVEHYPEMRDVGESWVAYNGNVIARPGIVHRLDRDTSGTLIVAKTQESYEHIKQQFKDRHVRKEYRAIVHGALKPEMWEGVIDKPIGKSPSDFRKWSAQRGARGVLRDARTEYAVIATSGVGNDGFSYVSAFPRTGRTHQIRVHFKAIHHPLVGDTLYAGKRTQSMPRARRTMLHAHSICFVHPCTGEQVCVESTLPTDFITTLNTLDLTT